MVNLGKYFDLKDYPIPANELEFANIHFTSLVIFYGTEKFSISQQVPRHVLIFGQKSLPSCSLFISSRLRLILLSLFSHTPGFLLGFRPELHHLASSIPGCSAASFTALAYLSRSSRCFCSLCLANCSSSARSLASSCCIASSCSMASICLVARSSSALSSASAKSFCCSCSSTL